MAALHRLDGIHDFFPAEAERSSSAKRRASNGKIFDSGESGLERIKIKLYTPLRCIWQY
jgi:hypothetical protein